MINKTDEYWMTFALKEAEKAMEKGEMPVGAIILHSNKIVGKGYNLRETLKDPTAHA
ncbi:MAG: nucleoside deaminase, partial [Candidatus Marinimicrobia bacterium]|nr:nucleoside deaminase [Candidatus Neomarinimicrobiota bacterium]